MDKEDKVHIYNGMLLSHKKNKIMPSAASWMDLDYHTKSERFFFCFVFLGPHPRDIEVPRLRAELEL